LNEPLPPLLHDPVFVAPVMVAERDAPDELEQIVPAGLTATVARGRTERTTISVSGRQFPLFVEVRTRVTVPALISAEPGVYVGFSSDPLLKLPLPVVLHEPVVAPRLTVPFRAAVALLQMVKSAPAFTSGRGVINITMVSFAAGQDPLLVVVRMTLTEPLEIAVAPGVKVVLEFVTDEKVPLPGDDQSGVEEKFVIEPERFVTALFAQTV